MSAGKSRVLIVDDARENLDLLSSILSDQYDVMAAPSGEFALKIMASKKPDIVLLDVSMPGMSGFDVLQYMKNTPGLANIPVIFVTGESDADSEEFGLLLGAVDYVKKPYNSSIIGIRVRNHIELKTYRDGLEELVRKRTEEVVASRDTVIFGMSLCAESRDKVTGTHIQKIKWYTSLIVDKMVELFPSEITKDYAEETVMFSPLHDVGKVSVADSILNKNGKLTDEEFREMQRHTVNGAELLKETKTMYQGNRHMLNTAVEIAEFHHEKYDGTGYPHGLKAAEIPLSARIIALADIYDALRSERPYKAAFTHAQATEIILKGDGRTKPSHFDPMVLEVFDLLSEDFEAISMY